MQADLKLFVVDTGPLITLAAAESLDYLLLVRGGVVVPDAVFYEATFDAAKLGAEDILEWVKRNHGRVEIAPTRAFTTFEAARLSLPKLREPNLGERSAVEVIEEPGRLGEGERAVLLCEETAVLRRVVVRDRERIVEMSTMDFLTALESERRIQSADAVFERALAAGRSASRAEKLPHPIAAINDEIRALVRR
jgi:hypothetical protein